MGSPSHRRLTTLLVEHSSRLEDLILELLDELAVSIDELLLTLDEHRHVCGPDDLVDSVTSEARALVRRVRRTEEGATVWQVYGLGGELLAEYPAGSPPSAPRKEYGYREGELLVVAEVGDETGGDAAWFDDALPASAQASGNGEGWSWVSSGPSPRSGSTAHQSAAVSGFHNHYFTSASQTLTVNTGDKLFAHILLDPADPPSEVMLQWHDGSQWKNAYWGADQINWVGGRTHMGALPAAGQWVRLEVAAATLGLEGRILSGMAFNLFGGRATWDRAGRATEGAPPPPVVAPTASVRWLVSDHLGTTRMVLDQTGSLPGVKRLDYLPFGEEMGAVGVGGRTTAQGYSQPDGVRQGFTGYEKDGETGLNYAKARYQSPTMGRFTSPDPYGPWAMSEGKKIAFLASPQ